MPHRRRVLVVEDDEGLRFGLARCFVLSGWEVLAAEDLAEAYAFLPTRNGRFGAALVDLLLPDGGGEDIIAAIKAIRAAPRVVAYTACGEGARVRRALAAGADAVIYKPASFVDVILPVILGTYPVAHADPAVVLFADPPPMPPAPAP